MEGNGETVNFILDPLKKEKFLRGAREFDDLERITKEQFMGLVLVILLKSCNRNVQSQLFLDDLLSDINLPQTPIDDDQIWWRQAIPHNPAIASTDDFPHAGIVIWPDDSLDLVLAIVFFAWLSIDKDNHGRNRTGPHDVGVIKRLNPHRSWNLQEFSKVFNSTLGLLNRFFKEIELLLQTDTRILDGQIDQLLLLPTLGFEDLGIH